MNRRYRLCGACLPDPRLVTGTKFGVCEKCGLHTMTAIDASQWTPIRCQPTAVRR